MCLRVRVHVRSCEHSCVSPSHSRVMIWFHRGSRQRSLVLDFSLDCAKSNLPHSKQSQITIIGLARALRGVLKVYKGFYKILGTLWARPRGCSHLDDPALFRSYDGPRYGYGHGHGDQRYDSALLKI